MNIKIEQSNLAKFIFSIGILFYHICIWGYDIHGQWINFIRSVCMFGFLFLSGYGLTISYYRNGLLSYWEKKFKKIYLPAIVVNLFAVLELLILNKMPYDRGQIFIEIFMFNQSPVINTELWFLRLLLIWYILFYIINSYTKNGKMRIFLWIVIALMMCYIIPETYGLANLYSLSFPIGVLYAECQKSHDVTQKFINAFKYLMFIIAISGGYILICYADDSGILFGTKLNFYVFMLIANIIFGCGALVIIYMSNILVKYINCLSQYASLLGNMSLMIYYLQRPFVLNPMIWSYGNIKKAIAMFIGFIFILVISVFYVKVTVTKERKHNV